MNKLGQRSDAVVVVGGGITGMTTALALDHRGIQVRLLERGRREARTGAGISIDRGVLERATGHCADALPVEHDRFYDLAAWDDIHGWLAARIEGSGVTVEHRSVVTSVIEDDAGVAVTLSDGSSRSAELLVGADGVRSVVRSHIAPHQPLAEYTGYTAWRGLVAERDLPPGRRDRGKDIPSSCCTPATSRCSPTRSRVRMAPRSQGGVVSRSPGATRGATPSSPTASGSRTAASAPSRPTLSPDDCSRSSRNWLARPGPAPGTPPSSTRSAPMPSLRRPWPITFQRGCRRVVSGSWATRRTPSRQ